MSIMYGLILGWLFYQNCHADTMIKKCAVFIITASISLIFGGLAARG
nr:MAG TPA_asm: hypothetical protein [Caudoviricetes sp.]